jgi:hypothetical protein
MGLLRYFSLNPTKSEIIQANSVLNAQLLRMSQFPIQRILTDPTLVHQNWGIAASYNNRYTSIVQSTIMIAILVRVLLC